LNRGTCHSNTTQTGESRHNNEKAGVVHGRKKGYQVYRKEQKGERAKKRAGMQSGKRKSGKRRHKLKKKMETKVVLMRKLKRVTLQR